MLIWFFCRIRRILFLVFFSIELIHLTTSGLFFKGIFQIFLISITFLSKDTELPMKNFILRNKWPLKSESISFVPMNSLKLFFGWTLNWIGNNFCREALFHCNIVILFWIKWEFCTIRNDLLMFNQIEISLT